MARYQQHAFWVEAEQFTGVGAPPQGVIGVPGSWELQPRFPGHPRSPIQIGEWVVRWPGGKREVWSDADFRASFAAHVEEGR